MALIKLGVAISEIRGSIEGTTFARNRAGQYMRNRSIPVNPNSARQQLVRNVLSQLAQSWQALTQAKRDAWEVFASNVPVLNKLGETIFLTGFNQFVRANAVILQCGGIVVDTAPVSFTLPEADSLLAIAGTADDQKLQITFDDAVAWCDEDGAYLQVRSSSPQDPTINFFGGPFRFAGAIEGDSVAAPSSPTEIDSPFSIAEGQKIWCECRIVRADGRVSNPFRASGVVAAS